MPRNKKRKTKWQWPDKDINWFLPDIMMTKESWNPIWPDASNWPEPTKINSLQCDVLLMTNSIKNSSNDSQSKRYLAIQFNKQLNWQDLTKSDSLRCYLLLMTNCMHKKLRYQFILSQDLDNQRIIQSEYMRGKPGNILPNYNFFRCCLCLKTNSMKSNYDII